MNERRLHGVSISGIILVNLFCFVASVGAQGTRADYERAMKWRETTANKVFKDRVTARWL